MTEALLSLQNNIFIYDDGRVEVYPPPPAPPPTLTDIKRMGRIATLNTDMLSPKWGFTPRRPGTLASWPQTSVLNHAPAVGKGKRLPLTPQVLNGVVMLNGERNADRLYNPPTGWINSKSETPQVDKISPTSESVSWAGNYVITLEQRIVRGLSFTRIFTRGVNEDLSDTFFSADGRLVVHAYNAIHKNGYMTRHGSGEPLYTPLTSPWDLWCATEELEFWPDLPFAIPDGRTGIEYVLEGYNIYMLCSNGDKELLRRDGVFQTVWWKIQNQEVPL